MARRNRRKKPPQERRQKLKAAGRGFFSLFFSLALGLGLGTAAYWAWWFVHHSPALSLRQIQVRGGLHTPLATVLAAAGLNQGMNLFEVDPAHSAARLEKLPWVRRAAVERRVPDTVLVELEEWQAAALVAAEGLYLASPEGEIFKRAAPADAADLPVISGIDPELLRREPQRARSILQRALGLLERFKRLPCLQERQIAELHLDELLGYSLVLDPGAVVVELDRAASEQPQLLCQALARAPASSRHLLLGYTSRGWQVVARRRHEAPAKIENQEKVF